MKKIALLLVFTFLIGVAATSFAAPARIIINGLTGDSTVGGSH